MSYTPGPLPEPDYQAGTVGMLGENCYSAERMQAHTAAEVARAVAAERERLALTDDAIEQAYNEAWRSLPSDFGHTSGDWFAAGARYVAALADPQRLQVKGE